MNRMTDKRVLKHFLPATSFAGGNYVLWVNKYKQECIPVGCVPSAAVASRGECVCLGGVHLPTCGQTDTCENITFPQLLLRTATMESH